MALSKKGRRILKKIPREPGVYVMKDGENEILYIGKAKDLRNRVKTYFDSNTFLSPQKIEMVRQIEDVEYIVVGSEEEALILEANLVKFNQPPFNVDLKDGKQYPYIKITNEDFPAISRTRNLVDSKARYYGPFTSARAVKNTVSYLVKAFQLRECKRMKKDKGFIKGQIGLCSAPCFRPEDNTDYMERIKVVDGLLRGRGKGLLRKLEGMMKEHTRHEKYEEAAVLRDIIADIKRLDPSQKVSLLPDSESDLFVVQRDREMDENLYCVLILKVRGGQVISENFFFVDAADIVLEDEGDDKEASLIRDALLRYYVMSYIPKRIVLEDNPRVDMEEIQKALKRIKSGPVKLVRRPTGKTRQLLLLARKNALLKIASKPTKGKGSRIRSVSKDPHQELVELKQDLGLPTIPYRIEAIDISNLQGDSAVGSLVTFLDALPSKKDYRRYNIRTVLGINDFEMVKEVVKRRYSKNPLPDLIMIDGGRIQVDFAVQGLVELGMAGYNVIGLAKRNEEIFLPDEEEPVVLGKRKASLHLLQRIRDESHRFAISLHRKQRKRRTVRSELDDIPGLGGKRVRLLLRRFGSIKKLKECSKKQLLEVPGIGEKLAEVIIEGLHKND
jgi:excinuclease ABC subunit C